MILVTGGTGFLGRALVPELMKMDDVRVISRKKPESGENCEVLVGDISDYLFVEKAMENVDYVFHLAKFKGHNFPYEKHYNTTVLGTRNVMEAAKKAGVKKVIHMSSTGVKMKHLTPYSRAKLEAEKIIKQSWNEIDAPIIRSSLVYDEAVVRKLKKYSWFLFPYKKQKIHLAYKHSVVQALIGAMKHGKSEVYDVGDKEPVLLTELYKELAKPRPMLFVPPQMIWLMIAMGYPTKLVCNALGIKPPITPTFVKYMFEDRVLDIEKAVEMLKYEPVDTLETVRKLK